MKIKRKIKRLKTNFVKNIDKCAIESINFIKYIYIFIVWIKSIEA